MMLQAACFAFVSESVFFTPSEGYFARKCLLNLVLCFCLGVLRADCRVAAQTVVGMVTISLAPHMLSLTVFSFVIHIFNCMFLALIYIVLLGCIWSTRASGGPRAGFPTPFLARSSLATNSTQFVLRLLFFATYPELKGIALTHCFVSLIYFRTNVLGGTLCLGLFVV